MLSLLSVTSVTSVTSQIIILVRTSYLHTKQCEEEEKDSIVQVL